MASKWSNEYVVAEHKDLQVIQFYILMIDISWFFICWKLLRLAQWLLTDLDDLFF